MTREDIQEILGFDIETTENMDFGDYSSSVAHKSGKNPEELLASINKNNKVKELFDRVEIKSGFINFWLKKDVLLNSLSHYDIPKIGKGKTVVIDYSSPNIAKPFGIGHLRSTIIGQALYNIFNILGYQVIGDNHLGDWGTQFGKLLFMINKTKTKDFSIENLENLYVKFHEHPEWDEEARKWFKKLEDGDKEARELWKKCVEVSLKEFDRVYEILGVKIDFAFGESYYESEIKTMINDPRVKKYLSDGEDGAKIIEIPDIKTPLMYLKSDGATTYATRDLATIIFRVRKWNPNIVIYEVGAEQTLYFRQIFAVARMMGLVGSDVELVHTAHGLYLSPKGTKFSTRKGETIKLEEVLDEAILRAKKLGNSDEKTAKAVGIGAIKYFDLMHHPASDIVFDWEKIINLEGNSGPYLQYTIARCNSLLAKSSFEVDKDVPEKLEKEEEIVLRTLFRFQDIIITAAKTYSPNLVCNYLYDLASKYNTFYNKFRIIGSESESFRAEMSSSVARTLASGLSLLGIEAPERM